MNKFLGLLLISSAVAVYAQNPLSKEEIFAQNVQQAHADYEKLTDDEKALCNAMGKNIAIQCARELKGMGILDLIPAEINPDDNLGDVDKALETAKAQTALSEERSNYVARIAHFRLSALWKAKADSVGKKVMCWPLIIQRDSNLDSAEYLD